MLAKMELDGNELAANLTEQLFPCGDAYEAITIATDVTCGDYGLVNRLIGNVIIMGMTVLFVTSFYFSVVSLAFLQNLQVRRIIRING